jgi:YVTN family beta-propeller protein
MIADVPLGPVVVWLTATYNVLAFREYIRDTWAGRIRPSWVSWLIWTVTMGTAFAASLAAGAVAGLVVAGTMTVIPAAIVAGIAWSAWQVRAGRRRSAPPEEAFPWQRRVELICGGGAVGTFVLWAATSNPSVALVAIIATDALAAVPTLTRAIRSEEYAGPYVGAAVAALGSLWSMTTWGFAEWVVVLYQLTVNVTLAATVGVCGSPPGGGGHAKPVRPTPGRRAAVLAATVVVMGSALALVSGVLPRPTAPTSTPVSVAEVAPAALANPAAVVPGGVRPVAVEAVAVPTVEARVSVPPTPGFLEMAPNGRYALIAHRTQMLVSVFDTQLGQVTTTIPTPQGPPRFVTFCPTAEDRANGRGGDRAYISMFDDPADQPPTGVNRHLVGVLDTRTNEMITTIPVSARPYAAACSPDGAQLWVPSDDDARVDVIDTATNALVRTVAVPPNPHWVAFSADGRKVYAACHDSNLVAVLDPLRFTVMRTIPVGASPHSLALSPDGRSLAVADYSSSQLSIIDTEHDAEAKRLPTGENPQDVAWSADGRLVYTANVAGVMNGHPVGNLSVINVATGGQSRLVTDDPSVDSAPTSVARSADGATGYVTNLRTGVVTVYALGR